MHKQGTILHLHEPEWEDKDGRKISIEPVDSDWFFAMNLA